MTYEQMLARYPRGGRWVAYNEWVRRPGEIPMKAMGYRYVPISTLDHAGACREAFRTVRRSVWTYRQAVLEASLRTQGDDWGGYG